MGIIRRIKKIIISRNPDNTVNNIGGSEEVHNVSDTDGALESVYCEETANHHCGCFAAPGGRCSECGAISCVKCHRHCGGTDSQIPLGCGKPLCREHSHYLTVTNGQSIPFCKRCYGKIRRKKNRQTVTKLLLEPFVETGQKDDDGR